jgi:dihydrofolate synthase / folylpolyglutamate synthase
MKKFTKLSEWLAWIGVLHGQVIDLGLVRVSQVAERMGLLKPACPVVTVAGTNGKGSTVAGLEAVYLAAGYRVGTFTSPYLYRFNELVRVQGLETQDDDFLRSFERIETARGETTLTQFEFNTLAALDIFQRSQLDVMILEVGLGGRLDAVNIIDADVAIITSIAIDHADRLGNTRELIGREKAGIFRTGKPVVCGDIDPPQTLIDYANELNAPLFNQNKEFGFNRQENNWTWWSQSKQLDQLPIPQLALQNMSCVMKTVELLQSKLPVSRTAIDQALKTVKLSGRIQVIPGEVTKILDVSHNPAAAEWLANYVRDHSISGKTRAVFSMLTDKDILSTVLIMKPYIDEWFIAPLKTERAASLSQLQQAFQQASIHSIHSYQSIPEAHQAAENASASGDRVVIFGSFYTVSAHAN